MCHRYREFSISNFKDGRKLFFFNSEFFLLQNFENRLSHYIIIYYENSDLLKLRNGRGRGGRNCLGLRNRYTVNAEV